MTDKQASAPRPQVDIQRQTPDKSRKPAADAPDIESAAPATADLTSPGTLQRRARTMRSLQRQVGNARVGQMVQRQRENDARYTVNPPDDEFEQEADRTADQVMRTPVSAPPQRQEPTHSVLQKQNIPGLPDPQQVAEREKATLTELGAGGPADSDVRIKATEGTQDQVQIRSYTVKTTASGSRGSIDTTTNILLVYDPGDPTITVLQPTNKSAGLETGMWTPEERPAYPVRIIYDRTISYADSDGRTADIKIEGNVQFTHETWEKATRGKVPTFETVQQLLGDDGFIRVHLLGKSTLPRFPYYANYLAAGNSISVQTEQAKSWLPMGTFLGFKSARSARFVLLNLTGGEQFASLHAFFASADAIELARRMKLEAEKDKSKSSTNTAWYEGVSKWIADSWLGRALSGLGNLISGLWNSLPESVRGVLSALAKAGLALAAVLATAAAIVALAPVELALSTVALVIGGIMLAVGFVSSLISRSEEAEMTGEGGALSIVFISLLDAVGVSAVVEAITDRSMLSGVELNQSEEEKWDRGTLGVIQSIATFLGIRAAIKRTPAYGRTTKTADPSLQPGEGGTDPFGNIEYSPHGSVAEQALVLHHEAVHSVLSPRLKLLRNFRARLSMSAYEKSSLLRYLEEALAESHAQLRVRGIRGLPEGIRFPVKNGYVQLMRPGQPSWATTPGVPSYGGRGVLPEAAIGTIVYGGIVYTVYLISDSEE